MSTESTDAKTLHLYIEEQRRFHDELTDSYRGHQTRIITYIGATLGLLAFLYAGALDAAKPTSDRLFIPDALYGQIFYFFGLFLVFYALGKLVQGARPNGVWTVAHESKDINMVERASEEEYLVKLKNDLDEAIKANCAQHARKFEAVKDSFYPLLLGAILLIVLRYFQ